MSVGPEGIGQPSKPRLDELLEEVQVRIEAVRGMRDRVHGLLEAVLCGEVARDSSRRPS